jgi:hypothetical protein
MGAPFRHLDIPSDAWWLYVSDSYTITLIPDLAGSAPYTMIHNPGVANQDNEIKAARNVSVFIKSCSLEFVPIAADTNQGVNVDLMLGIYYLTKEGKWDFKKRLRFISPYGTATNGQLLNHVCKLSHNSPPSIRNFGDRTPMKLGIKTPPDPEDAQYKIGAHMQFNFGTTPILGCYQYHVHAAIVATE